MLRVLLPAILAQLAQQAMTMIRSETSRGQIVSFLAANEHAVFWDM